MTLQASSSSPVELDVRGLRCPMPLLKTKLELNKLKPGDHLRVYVTDPGSVRDFHSYAELSPHKLAEFHQFEEVFEYLFVVGEQP